VLCILTHSFFYHYVIYSASVGIPTINSSLVTNSSFKFTWTNNSKSNGDFPVISFNTSVEQTDNHQRLFENTRKVDEELIGAVNNLTSYTNYTIKVRAYNRLGVGSNEAKLIVLTDERG